QALAEGELKAAGEQAGKRVLIVKGEEITDAITGEKVAPAPATPEDVRINNRLRGAVQGALAALKLTSSDQATRLAAVNELAGGADDAMLPLVKKALDRETDPAIKTLLVQIA